MFRISLTPTPVLLLGTGKDCPIIDEQDRTHLYSMDLTAEKFAQIITFAIFACARLILNLNPFSVSIESDKTYSNRPHEAVSDALRTEAYLAKPTHDILRWIRLMGGRGHLSPPRHPTGRRRIRTVMQELMPLVARLVKSRYRLKLKCQ